LTFLTVTPGASASGVKMMVPFVSRICVLSMLSVSGCDCRSSGLNVKWTPMSVARSRCSS
jgi:hypothetical protein